MAKVANPRESSNEIVEEQLDARLEAIEKVLAADVLTFACGIFYGSDDLVRDHIEARKRRRRQLYVILETDGGYIETAERIARVLRSRYRRVCFMVPNYAMSAGTVLALSGDEVLMDYYSILGPIDPQVRIVRKGQTRSVPVVGYLKAFEKLAKKSAKADLSAAEVLLVDAFDPAELYSFEHAVELSVALLKEWLVKYKFRNWKKTRTHKITVTKQMRMARAERIGRQLCDVESWRSHNRGIPAEVLRRKLKLEIRDFGKEKPLSEAIRRYDRLLKDYMVRLQFNAVVHTPSRFTGLRIPS